MFSVKRFTINKIDDRTQWEKEMITLDDLQSWQKASKNPVILIGNHLITCDLEAIMRHAVAKDHSHTPRNCDICLHTARLFSMVNALVKEQPTNGLQIIRETDLPEEFQIGNLYRDLSEANVNRFKQWCKDNGVYYYARPAAKFFEHEARYLAEQAGCTKLLLENMS